jgi:hypothetical protein
MFPQDPQQRLSQINHRNAELIHTAAQNRLAGAQAPKPADHRRARVADSFRAGLGRAIAEMRRTLFAREAPCDDSAQV